LRPDPRAAACSIAAPYVFPPSVMQCSATSRNCPMEDHNRDADGLERPPNRLVRARSDNVIN
jgi:hypothetical protein